MQTLSAKDAKYGFGRLIDLARAEPITVTKYGRPVVVVLSAEEYERLKNCGAETLPRIEERSAGRESPPQMPANKKKDPRYAGIYRDMPGYSGMRPRRLRPMIVGVPPRVGAAYAGIGRRHCGSRLLIHQMAFKPRFPGGLGSLK